MYQQQTIRTINGKATQAYKYMGFKAERVDQGYLTSGGNFETKTSISPEVLNKYTKSVKGLENKKFSELEHKDRLLVFEKMFFDSRSPKQKRMISPEHKQKMADYEILKLKHKQALKAIKNRTDLTDIERNTKTLEAKKSFEKIKKPEFEEMVFAKEFTVTVDKVLSIAIDNLPEAERQKVFKLMDEANDYALELVELKIKENHKEKLDPFEKAKTARIKARHETNRDGHSHHHIHTQFLNIQERADGKIVAIDIPMENGQFQRLVKNLDIAFHTKLNSLIQKDEYLKDKLSITAIGKEENDHRKISKVDKFSMIYEYKQNELSEKFETYLMLGSGAVIEREEEIEKAIKKIEQEHRIEIACLDKSAEDFDRKLIYLNERKKEKIAYIQSKKNRTILHSNLKNKKTTDNETVDKEWLKEVNSRINILVHPRKELFKSNNIFDYIEEITENKNYFEKEELEAYILAYGEFDNIPNALKAMDKIVQLLKEQSDIVEKNGVFIPSHLLELEDKTIETVKDLISRKPDQVRRPADLDPRITLTPTQEQAYRDTCGTGPVSLIRGIAGSGKSFVATLIANHHVNQEGKKRVIVLAPTNKAVSELKSQFENQRKNGLININENQIEYMTIDKFNLIKDKNIKDSLVLVDEAGMISSKNFSKMVQELKPELEKNSKLVLIGDQHQLQSVNVGGTFARLISDKEIKNQKGSVSEMLEINRQKNETDKKLAEIVSGSKISAVEYQDKIDDNRLVKEVFDFIVKNEDRNYLKLSKNPINEIVNDYVEFYKKGGKTGIILASTNKSVDEINKEIQEELFKNASNGWMTDEGKKFFEGDKIMFSSRIKDEEGRTLANNGEIGFIKEFDNINQRVIIAMENGSNIAIEFTNKALEEMNLAYAVTVNKSQGMTVDKSFIYLEKTQLNTYQNLYVAITRHKEEMKIYSKDDKFEDIKRSYETKNPKKDIFDEVLNERRQSNQKAFEPEKAVNILLDKKEEKIALKAIKENVPEFQSKEHFFSKRDNCEVAIDFVKKELFDKISNNKTYQKCVKIFEGKVKTTLKEIQERFEQISIEQKQMEQVKVKQRGPRM